MSHITSIGIANPEKHYSQMDIAEFMAETMGLDAGDSRRLRAVFRSSGIHKRHAVIEDYGGIKPRTFFSETLTDLSLPSTKTRMEWYRKHALPMSLKAIRQCLLTRPDLDLSNITHLIVVSCTGMYAPGLDIDIVNELGLSPNIKRMCINFMGCYAAFNALKIADAFCKNDVDSHVLVLCTELCSLHFQTENTEDNMLANALFADGAAAVLVEHKPVAGINLNLQQFYCDLAPTGAQDMAWIIGDRGFEMKLSSYVPEIIRTGIKRLTAGLLKQRSQKISDIHYFAIHPGGRKILETIEQELGLVKNQNKYSYEVLEKYGNMSSPTVLFVLHALTQNLMAEDHGKTILSFAFGPGLTLESMLLTIEYH